MKAGTQTKKIFLLCSIFIRYYYYYKTRNKTSLYLKHTCDEVVIFDAELQVLFNINCMFSRNFRI